MRLVAAAGALAIAVTGIGRGEPGGFTLESARAFDDFPLVWAGDRVGPLPLTALVRRNDTAEYVSFVYGDCTATSDRGCAPPLEIQVWPAGERNLASYGAAHAPSPEPTRARGVSGAFVGKTQLELYAPRATIVVFADSRERLLEAAAALRCLSGGQARDGPLDC